MICLWVRTPYNHQKPFEKTLIRWYKAPNSLLGSATHQRWSGRNYVLLVCSRHGMALILSTYVPRAESEDLEGNWTSQNWNLNPPEDKNFMGILSCYMCSSWKSVQTVPHCIVHGHYAVFPSEVSNKNLFNLKQSTVFQKSLHRNLFKGISSMLIVRL